MKKICTLLMGFALFYGLFSCSDSGAANGNAIEPPADNTGESISPVTGLTILDSREERGINVSWKNPLGPDVRWIEVAFGVKGGETRADVPSTSPSPTLIDDFVRGGASRINLVAPTYDMYVVTVTAVGKTGKRSEGVSVEARPYKKGEGTTEPDITLLEKADVMMSSMIELMLGGPRDLWSSYPRNTAALWNGDATLWGQGAAISAFSSMRGVVQGTELEEKYKGLEDRIFNGTEKFLHVIDGVEAYAVYPGPNNDRYYDDNVWIGLDMADLYSVSRNARYLDRARTVWSYLLKGTDETVGGGIHWRERSPASKSKHACSTAPAIVLACKLYVETNEAHFLNSAKTLYEWMVAVLQDPDDHLIWDNAREDDTVTGGIKVDKSKYSYNSGQLMQAAALLYEITGETHYLDNARNIAASAYSKWFSTHYSYVLNRSVITLTGAETNRMWMLAVMVRGFTELYRVDPDAEGKYADSLDDTLFIAWEARNPDNNFVASDLRQPQSGSTIHLMETAAVVEMFGRMAKLRGQ